MPQKFMAVPIAIRGPKKSLLGVPNEVAGKYTFLIQDST